MPIIWVFVIVWSGTSIAEASQPDFEISWPYMVKDILFIGTVLWAVFAEREIRKLQAQLKHEKRKARECSSKG